MVRVNDADVVEKGRLDPGQMIVVDLKDGTLFHDHEIKGYLASRQNSARGSRPRPRSTT